MSQLPQVPESAYELGHAGKSDVIVAPEVVLVGYNNYPPCCHHMHYDLKTYPPGMRRKAFLQWLLHLLMIIGPLWNIVVCAIELIFGGISSPLLKLILSIIFFFLWTVVGYFHFYNGMLLLTQARGSVIAYYFTALVLTIRFGLWSIVSWGDANGFIAMSKLFSRGKVLGGIFCIVYIVLTIPTAVLAALNAVMIYRR